MCKLNIKMETFFLKKHVVYVICSSITAFLKAKKETLEGGFGLKHRTEIVQIDSERYLKTGLENVGPNKILREIVEKN